MLTSTRDRKALVYSLTLGALALTFILWAFATNAFSVLGLVVAIITMIALALYVDAGARERWDSQNTIGNWAMGLAVVTLLITLFSMMFSASPTTSTNTRDVTTHTPTTRPLPGSSYDSGVQGGQPETQSTYDWQSYTNPPTTEYQAPQVTVEPAPTTVIVEPAPTTVRRTTTPRTTPQTTTQPPPEVFSEPDQGGSNPPAGQQTINPTSRYTGVFSQPAGG